MMRQAWPYFEGYPFQERWVHLDGLAIHYLDEGFGRRPVLMVHGNPAWSYMWRRLMPPLSDSYRALALDLMGFGKSEKPHPNLHDFSHHTRIVSGFIESLGLRNLVLIVHDWGGPFAMQYAVRHQNNLAGLVLTNTFLTTDFHIPPSVAVRITPAVIKESSLRPENISDRTMEAYWAPFPDEESKRAYQAFPSMFPDSPSHPTFRPMKEIEQALPSLKIPTLIIWGTGRTGSSYAEKISKIIPGSKLQAVNAGHFVPEDAPGEVERLVLDFLSTLSDQSSPQNELKAPSQTKGPTKVEG